MKLISGEVVGSVRILTVIKRKYGSGVCSDSRAVSVFVLSFAVVLRMQNCFESRPRS